MASYSTYKNYQNYMVTTAPTNEPITLSEAKEHLRVTDTAEDTLITSLISVAREWAEKYELKAYMTQTITAHYDAFSDKMYLPIAPALAITSITYIDEDEVEQTLDSSYYELSTYDEPAYVYPAYGISYPSVLSVPNTITVTYTAGYSATADDTSKVPERVKASIKLILSHLYEHREQNSEVSLTELPFSAKNLLMERAF